MVFGPKYLDTFSSRTYNATNYRINLKDNVMHTDIEE